MNYFRPRSVVRIGIRMVLVTICFLIGQPSASAAKIVYISTSPDQSYARQQTETAANFYGLPMNVVILAGGREVSAALEAIRDPKTVAVVIDTDALPGLNQEHVFTSIQKRKQAIPLLITGINEHTSPALIRKWSSGAITGCQRSTIAQATAWYSVARVSGVTNQLSGTKLPLHQKQVVSLKLDSNNTAQWLVQAESGSVELPVFARAIVAGQEVFFAAENEASEIPVSPDPYRQQAIFATIASPMIFLRYAAGERAWHSPGAYANLTIDDLWLREPYGHVNYEELLQRAQQHNYHVTIAFIPWNFDRSEPRMVTLFQAHPERLSICIHGNNHIHQEFGPFDTHPLEKQEEDIRQALARMERFKQLTNIPYDAVMVFPHSISPEATLSALRITNYLATANSLNVPSDATAPSDIEFALRTATLHFANFPSLRRYSAETEIPMSQLAIDAFLGNPMLFYVHESFFASGIDAFNKTADTVNELQPDTKWRGLGDIAQHLYLEKLRDDGNFDIRAYSGTIRLLNDHKRDVSYFVEKEENFAQPLKVLVDGHPYPFERSGIHLRLELQIKDGMDRQIEIKYGNSLNLAQIDISKNSPKTTTIRLLSDFRDNVVSNTTLGRWFIRSYVDHGSDWNRAIAILSVLLVLVLAKLYVRRDKRVPLPQRSFPYPGRGN